MPRKLSETGVGRGNGAGSKQTQFQNGLPSANPRGRPRKRRPRPGASMVEVIQQLMTENVTVELGENRKTKMRRFDAIARQMINQLNSAPLHQKLAFFQKLGGLDMTLAPPPEPDPNWAAKLVDFLISQADDDDS